MYFMAKKSKNLVLNTDHWTVSCLRKQSPNRQDERKKRPNRQDDNHIRLRLFPNCFSVQSHLTSSDSKASAVVFSYVH